MHRSAEPEGPVFSSPLVGCAERSYASSDSCRFPVGRKTIHAQHFVAAAFVLDIRHLSSQAKPPPSAPTAGDQVVTSAQVNSAAASRQLDLLRPLVASLLTFGLDESIDTSIREAFTVSSAPNFCGISRSVLSPIVVA
jgi:hypothetical protein